jgi:hypothetical protein
MNRLTVSLLAVLIVLVAAHGFLVWRAGEQAQDEAETQTCLQRTQTTAIVALVTPSLIVKTDEDELEGKLEAIAALGAQSDAC